MSGAGLPASRAWVNRPLVLVGMGAFWAAESVFGLFTAAMLVAEGKDMPGWMLAAAVGISLLLMLIGARLAVYCLRQLGAPAPVIGLGPDGLFDRRLADAPIPWGEVAVVDVYYLRSVQVMFDLTPAGNARVRPFERFLARLSRMMLMHGYSVVLMGTDADASDLAAAMRGWFAATRPPPALGADPA